MENEMTKRQMQGCKVLEIDGVDPKRALFELRDGKFWDGEPATRKEDGTSKEDGFYFVELDGGRILNDNIYSPYASAVEAEIAARKTPTMTDFNRAVAELVRKGRVRGVVGEDGVPRYWAVEPALWKE
jgi:hypothetical protein